MDLSEQLAHLSSRALRLLKPSSLIESIQLTPEILELLRIVMRAPPKLMSELQFLTLRPLCEKPHVVAQLRRPALKLRVTPTGDRPGARRLQPLPATSDNARFARLRAASRGGGEGASLSI